MRTLPANELSSNDFPILERLELQGVVPFILDLAIHESNCSIVPLNKHTRISINQWERSK